MINARHVTYEQAFGVCVCVCGCVCVEGVGGGGWKRAETDAKVFNCCSRVTRYREKKGRRGGIITDVCSVERDGRLSFLGT